MTKLNITNKTIYKLKKNKNQSKKNVPKKRKYKKRKHKNGRSFRKRRRKYNIKNNSIKKYKKQRGGVKVDKTKSIKTSADKSMAIVQKERELEELNKQIEDKRAEINNIRNVELKKYDEDTAQKAQDSENTKEASNDAVKLIEGQLNNAKDYQNYVGNIRDTHKKRVRIGKYEGLLITLKTRIKDEDDIIKSATNKIKSNDAKIVTGENSYNTIKGKLTGINEELGKANNIEIKEGEKGINVQAEQRKKDNAIANIQKKKDDAEGKQRKWEAEKKTLEDDTTKKNEEIKEAKDKIITLIKDYINFKDAVEGNRFQKRPEELKPENDDNFELDYLETKIKALEIAEFDNTNFEEYYEKVKATKLEQIFDVFDEEKKWIDDEIDTLEQSIDKVKADEKERENERKNEEDKEKEKRKEIEKK